MVYWLEKFTGNWSVLSSFGAKRLKMSSPENTETEKVDTVTLDSLPVEVLLLIFDFIDSKTLLKSLMFVNKHFYSILSDEYLWKRRTMCRFNDCNVAFMMTDSYHEDAFNWKHFELCSESEYNCWSNYQTKTTTKILRGAHFSDVDVVKMTQYGQMCISGSRDRSICLWSTIGDALGPLVHKANSHDGWIWDIQMYDEDKFLSSGWDSKVNLWNMSTFSPLSEPLLTFRTDTAVLSVTSKHNFIAAGLYSPKVVAFDPRESEKLIFEINPHRRSIMKLCLIEDNYLVSLSEDKTVSAWDLRVHRCIKSMLLAKHSNSFPMCASYYDNVLFIGDSQGQMHWLDCSNGTFNILKSVKLLKPENESNLRYKINSISCTNHGSVIYGGNEGAVNIITPSNPPKVMAKIDKLPGITSIDYNYDTLVVGFVNSDVQIWKKKNY